MPVQIRYSDEFKIYAVAQITERGCSVKEIAERLGISTKSLYTWMVQFSKPQRQTDQEAEVSRDTGFSKRRIQQMLDLAFIAPDTIRGIVDGRQPVGFTSDWCLRHELPSDTFQFYSIHFLRILVRSVVRRWNHAVATVRLQPDRNGLVLDDPLFEA